MRKIYFIGAGPGDKELITLKGYRILSDADIVIYAGSLINIELLDYCKEGVVLYDSATMTLEDIVSVMKNGAENDKLVARLQTGDISIYGSIREQAEELKKLGIEYESIAGVSSFLGAASSLGIEYTVPEISQSLIITRISGRTPVPDRESLRSFAVHQTSMAIFLSVNRIGDVVEELTAGGYRDDTPVAVVYKATWDDEMILIGVLSDIEKKVNQAGISKTALILVGNFLGKEYNYSKLYSRYFSHEYRTGCD